MNVGISFDFKTSSVFEKKTHQEENWKWKIEEQTFSFHSWMKLKSVSAKCRRILNFNFPSSLSSFISLSGKSINKLEVDKEESSSVPPFPAVVQTWTSSTFNRDVHSKFLSIPFISSFVRSCAECSCCRLRYIKYGGKKGNKKRSRSRRSFSN